MQGRWLVESMGIIRPLYQIDSLEFQTAVRPLKNLIERAISEADPPCDGVKVVFFVHPARGLCFRLMGKPDEVRVIAGLVRNTEVYRQVAPI